MGTTSKQREEALAELTGPGGPFEVVEAEVLGIPMRVYAHAPTSMRALLETTAAHGDRDFLVYRDERYSFRDHLGIVAGMATWLRDHHGVAKGDRVAIGMRNYPEWLFTFWATQALGAVAVPLNAWWLGAELRYALEDSGTKVAVVDGERLVRLEGHLDGLDLALVVSRHDRDLPAGVERWEDVLAGLDRSVPLPPVDIDPDDDATILYTSGTTGQPKGAIGTQRNHITNFTNTALAGALAAVLAGTPADPAAPPSPPAGLQTFPFFHIGGLSGLYVLTGFGGKLVLQYKWDLEEALELIRREQITALSAVPTIVRQILESPLLEQYDLSSVAGISSGGAPVPPDLIRRIDQDFASKVSPANGYGLTETTSAIVMNAGQDYVERPDSVGRPVVVADVRVVDPGSGADQPSGSIGEIWFRGPNVVRGYWNKPEATAEAFTDGWFHTGDLGYVDDEGFLYVVDRMKDVVIRGGENVYCAEVEAVLFEHPAVADVAIVGVPHRSLGEEVAAVVVVKPGATATAGELQEHVAARLARFKVPEHVVFRNEPLPRTATGKVLKRDLRDELATR
jgi:long-chain acyl-CoA synthetase